MTKTRLCNKCGRELPIDNWAKSKQDNSSAWCKLCKSEYDKLHYRKHDKKYKAKAKAWRENNKDIYLENGKKYYKNNINKWNKITESRKLLYHTDESYRQSEIDRKATWRKNNPNYMSAYQTQRLKYDTNFRLLCNLRSRIRMAIKNQRSDKAYKSIELLGCSIEECRKHIESQFKEGMIWDNYGEWHIDHIRPCAAFDLTDPDQQKECFNYKNLQPLWAKENLSKSDKWTKN